MFFVILALYINDFCNVNIDKTNVMPYLNCIYLNCSFLSLILVKLKWL